MSSYLYQRDSDVFIKAQHVGAVLQILKNEAFETETDECGNITSACFVGDYMSYDDELCEALSPYMRDGNFFEFCNDMGSIWRWVFKGGKCERANALIFWPTTDKPPVLSASDIKVEKSRLDGAIVVAGEKVEPGKQRYRIPLVWQMWGCINIEAGSEADAKAIALSHNCPLPEGYYLDDSIEIDEDGIIESGDTSGEEIWKGSSPISIIRGNSKHLQIEGHFGRWYVIGEQNTGKHGMLYLLESECYGDDAPCLIVDAKGKVIVDEVHNGFSDYQEKHGEG